ncbi:hypothetical protein ACWOC1_09730 [Enterococcus quebecensis]|uniref:RloB domain-containing protein n=1 Tax=Enterococcus quebecensis TaxID=903983 RepID=A0A1E5GT76_9ENTE|nr:hypothetical protein [Enterococcus quebecensis]OEG15888.1 hypothetical protein BCR23_07000 [Enterococcus quebecensis]OJG72060.1 hypothetical protein RV12_GL001032 [Enterococcus quebecensis]
MAREIKKLVHLYIPEDSGGNKPNTCEAGYFQHLFQRRLKNHQLKFYTEPQTNSFKKALKSNEFKEDLFFVLTDLDYKEDRSNISDVVRDIRSLSNEYREKATIVVSGRSWEVWVCMHKCAYTKPFSTQKALNKDVQEDYVKKHQWYKKESINLYSTLDNACANARIARGNRISGCIKQPDSKNYVTELPDFGNEALTQWFIKEVETFTYVDFLVEKLKALCL